MHGKSQTILCHLQKVVKFQSAKMGQILCVKKYLFTNPATYMHVTDSYTDVLNYSLQSKLTYMCSSTFVQFWL